MSASKSKLSIIMAIYIGMHLAGIIYNINFAILIVNEIYGRNRRSTREPGGSKKKSSIMRVAGKYERVGHRNMECYPNSSKKQCLWGP
jgi:hypothetical protein